MKSDQYEWELAFERLTLRKRDWNLQPRDERIDPLRPDGRYGAVTESRLVNIGTGEILVSVAVPEGAKPICWARRCQLDNEVIGWTHFTGWQFDSIRYIVPVSEDGVVGRAFFEVVRD